MTLKLRRLTAVLVLAAAPVFAKETPVALDIERLTVEPAPLAVEAGINPRYTLDRAAWIWHPDAAAGQEAILWFENEFELGEPTELTFHVSADQRYELKLDGQLVSFGPDRCDVAHWSFATYRARLGAGKHRFEAIAAWIDGHAPDAQHSAGPGFAFAVEGPLGAKLDTGSGHWRVREVDGWTFEESPMPWSVGSPQTIDAAKFFTADPRWAKPVVVQEPLTEGVHGVMRHDRRLRPTRLPEQRRTLRQVGEVRAVVDPAKPFFRPITAEEIAAASEAAGWNALLQKGEPLTVPARTKAAVLVDLGDYFTAFPVATLGGGRESRVTLTWSEALYETDAAGKPTNGKGDRDEIAGKSFGLRPDFPGYHDTFVNDGGTGRDFRTWWWRAGRYVMITVETADEPLVLERLALLETGYPLDDEGAFESSDPSLDATHPLMVRGMQTCSHEAFMDCPYYEQLMYVGDTRLEMLTSLLMERDPRLVMRCIELYDWSRTTWQWEMVAMRYPSQKPQASATYSLIWISMIRDLAFWRDEPEFIKERLLGMRSLLEHFRQLRGPSGLLEELPGWPFVDWVEGWLHGVAPDGRKGISSINNLHFVQALRHAAEVEDAFGDPVLAERNRALADELSAEIFRRFWVADRSLLADDEAHRHFSEHAQCLALLNGALSPAQAEACFESLISADDLARTTIYFSFYLFETFKQHDRGDLIVERMDFWKELVAKGLKTPVEKPDPTRSDCHAWGSHPLFHGRASLFGLRPAAPGFAKVEIAPSPGDLTSLKVRAPHPLGFVEGDLQFEGSRLTGTVALPEGVEGEFVWRGKRTPIAGTVTLDLE